VRVRATRVRTLLGYDIDEGEMRAILKRLACEVAQESGAFRAKPPTWRFDLAIEEDFRRGDRAHSRLRARSFDAAALGRADAPVPEGRRTTFELRHLLAALGYQEVVNYSFVAEAWEADFANNPVPVRLANPIASTMSVMRTTLIGGLVQTLRSNLNRGEPRVRAFEIGRCFEGETADIAVQPERIAGIAFGLSRPEQWAEKGAGVDFFDAKGDVETLAGGRPLVFAAGAHPACHPGRCALISLEGRVIGSSVSCTPAGSRNTSFPARRRCSNCERTSSSTGSLRALPECPGCPSSVATWRPFSPKTPLWGPSWRRFGAGCQPGPGSSTCSISTGERASRPAEKALRFV
jgi:phenylalanyl-tRNA synthetase beta chain